MISTFHISVLGTSLFVKKIKRNEARNMPTLVFLHDALGSIEQWKNFPEKLSESCGLDAIVFDRQGHGHSAPMSQKREKDYLHSEALKVLPELLKTLEIERPLLIGHSDGGTIALLYAANFKPLAVVAEAAHVLVEEVTLKGIRHAVDQQEILQEKLNKYHHEKTTVLFSAWSETWLNPDFRDWNIEDEMSRIDCPTFLIQGKQDEYASPEHLSKIKNGIGENSRQWLVESCGHFPHKQATKEVLEAMRDFIKSTFNLPSAKSF